MTENTLNNALEYAETQAFPSALQTPSVPRLLAAGGVILYSVCGGFMRRANKEIRGIEEKLAVLEKCKVCRLAMAVGGTPYVTPLNFGFEWKPGAADTDEGHLTLFFHSAQEGRKIDMLKANPAACFEVDTGHSLIRGDYACGYSFAFESVIGSGTVTFIEDKAGKKAGLDAIMRQQTGKSGCFFYEEDVLEKTAVFRLDVSEWTGKRREAVQKPH